MSLTTNHKALTPSVGLAEPGMEVSALTRVEAEQQIVARRLGGHLTASKQRKVQAGLAALLDQSPLQAMGLGSALWDLALAQMSQAQVDARTLDRLHLAAMRRIGRSPVDYV